MTVSLLGTAAFAEQTKWTQVETASTSADFAPLMNGEYYEASTPSGEKNTLYVKGKTRPGIKMLRIALYNIRNTKNYVNVFVQPASDGGFAVKIDTTAKKRQCQRRQRARCLPAKIRRGTPARATKSWTKCPRAFIS